MKSYSDNAISKEQLEEVKQNLTNIIVDNYFHLEKEIKSLKLAVLLSVSFLAISFFALAVIANKVF